MYTNRSLKKVNKICRYCNCPTDQLDEPNTMKKSKLKYTQISQIKELVEKNDLDRLAQMSCYALANAFYKLASVDDERGINGLTPAKLLHWIQLRLFMYLVDGLMGLQKFLKQNRTGTGKRKMHPHSSTRKTSLKKKRHNSTCPTLSLVICAINTGPDKKS
jgi:hypothetical protein